MLISLLNAVMLIAALSATPAADSVSFRDAAKAGAEKPKKPSLSLTATPMIAFTPANVSLTGEVKGGPDDYEELYCAGVEWDWGDDTTSESTVQCEPYEAGKSKIKRFYTIRHEFKIPGVYRVRLRLKQKNKVILSANVMLQINPGIRDRSPLPPTT